MQPMCLWALLAACQPTSPPQGDAQLYVIAVSGGDLSKEARLALCAQLSSAEKHAECVAAVLSSGPQSSARCEEIPAGRWQDECWFRLAELKTRSAPIPEAAQMCRRAGQYFRPCVGHVMSQQLVALLRTPDADEEARLEQVARFAEAWGAAVGKESTERDAWRFYWELQLAGAADPARCDVGMMPVACEEALVSIFRVQLKAHLQQDPGQWCRASRLAVRQEIVSRWVSPPGETRWEALDDEAVRGIDQFCR
jgi:hypothetical protein